MTTTDTATKPRRSPAWTVLRTELRLFLREPGSMFWIIAFPTALLLVLGAIPSFRETGVGDQDDVRVIDLYVPVAVLLSTIMAALQAMPVVMSGYREQGVLRRIATTPARPWHLLMAQYVVHGLAVVVGAVLAVVVAGLVYDVRVPGQLGAYVLVLLLALLSSLALGGIVSGVAPTARLATTFGTILFFPAMFTAGVWLPVSTMPGLLGDIVSFTPLGAAALGLDEATAGSWPSVTQVVVLVAWTLGLGGVAARYFRWQ